MDIKLNKENRYEEIATVSFKQRQIEINIVDKEIYSEKHE